MFSDLSLSNFKGFKKLERISMKPVTVLCGANSSGKSSILQSFLLWKQTLESRNPRQLLVLNGALSRLGSFDRLVYGRRLDREVGFEFDFGINTNILGPKSSSWPKQLHVSIETTLIASSDLPTDAPGPLALPLRCRISMIAEKEHHGGCASLLLESDKDGSFLASWSMIGEWATELCKSLPAEGSVNAAVEFATLLPRSVLPGSRCPVELAQALTDICRVFGVAVQAAFGSISYIGPLREEPSRRYFYDDEVLDIGTRGENAALIYLTEQYKSIPAVFTFNETKGTYIQEGPLLTLSVALKRWLGILGIEGFDVQQQGEVVRLNLTADTSADRPQVNIADVGFGVSQVLPILIEGLRLDTERVLLLEQPEIHLHPKTQSVMADFFVSMALGGKQVVVETHSDHIVNRLVRRIVEDRTGKIGDTVAVFFLESSPQGTICRPVTIDPDFGIKDWPEGFFDQNASEQEQIVQAGISKRLARRQELP